MNLRGSTDAGWVTNGNSGVRHPYLLALPETGGNKKGDYHFGWCWQLRQRRRQHQTSDSHLRLLFCGVVNFAGWRPYFATRTGR